MNFLKSIQVSIGSFLGLGWVPGGGAILSAVIIAILVVFADLVEPFYFPTNIPIYAGTVTLIMIAFAVLLHSMEGEYRKRAIIDQCIGLMFIFLFTPISWETGVMGFSIYSILIIVKPFPIYKLEYLPNGAGMVLDDAVSGIITALFLHGIRIAYHSLMSYL